MTREQVRQFLLVRGWIMRATFSNDHASAPLMVRAVHGDSDQSVDICLVSDLDTLTESAILERLVAPPDSTTVPVFFKQSRAEGL